MSLIPIFQFADVNQDTAQAQADYWAWVVQIGRGQWQACLCHRGILGLPDLLPTNTELRMVIPAPHEMFQEKRQVVFAAAGLREIK